LIVMIRVNLLLRMRRNGTDGKSTKCEHQDRLS
jgi:hypothetical protein